MQAYNLISKIQGLGLDPQTEIALKVPFQKGGIKLNTEFLKWISEDQTFIDFLKTADGPLIAKCVGGINKERIFILDEDIRTWARIYLERGFSVVPLKSSSKEPVGRWRDYMKERMSLAFVDHLFQSNSGIAIVSGEISGVTVVDIDDMEKFNQFFSFDDLSSQCGFIVKSPRGFHLYFRFCEELKNLNLNEYGFEIKNGKTLVVAPPTVINGVPYSFLKLKEPQTIPESFLKKILSLRKNKSLNKNQALFSVLEKLQILTGYTPQERAPGIWRTKCPAHDDKVPSLDVEMVEGEIQFRCWAGCDRKEIFEALGVKEEKWTKQSPKINYRLTTLEEVLQYPEVDYLIDEVLPSGIVAVLGAYTGAGKSITALSIIKSVLTGERLWGKYSVLKGGPVLLVDEETPKSFLRERVEKIGFEKRLPFFFLHFQDVRLDKEDCFNALMARIEEVKPTLVIFDSLIRIHRQKEDDATAMSLVVAQLRKIANRGVTVLVIHHHRKGEGPLSQKLRGSSDIPGGIDIEYALIPKEGYLQFSSVKTRTRPIEPIKLKLQIDENSIEVIYAGTEEEEIETAIIEILQGGEKLGVNEIWEEIRNRGIEVGINKLRDILKRSVNKGLVKSEQKPGRGRASLFWINNDSSRFTPYIYAVNSEGTSKNPSFSSREPKKNEDSREETTQSFQGVRDSSRVKKIGGREGLRDGIVSSRVDSKKQNGPLRNEAEEESLDLSQLEVEIL